jgi:hypothetical protein
VLALSACAATPAAAAERRVPQGWLGVTVDGPMTPSREDEWDRMVDAGVETVRLAMRWSAIQPKRRRPPTYAFTDPLVEAAAKRGIAVSPVVESTPAWASLRRRDYASPPRDPADVRRLFGGLVGRYGPGGAFWAARPDLPYLPIRAWQVYNEPSLRGFWSEQPFARSYVRVLRAAERTVHAADPGATVVLAGLTNRSWRGLRKIYAAGGRGHFDAVALHPYTPRPADVLRVVRRARQVMRAHGDGDLPVWITEFTWTASRGKIATPFILDTTDQGQARKLADVLRRFVAARTRARIARIFWYTWLSDEDRTGAFHWSGLRRLRDGSAVDTPALRVFRRVAQRLQGCAKAPRNAQACAP